jgi:hypothetical protein
VAGSTGVPAVDRLLGIYEENLDKLGASGRPGPSGGDLQPAPSKASEPVEVRLSDGSRVSSVVYVARDGKICLAAADLDGDDSGSLGCEAAAGHASRMAREDGYVPAIEIRGNEAILRGYVGTDVVSLRGHGPNGALDVDLGDPWAPASPGLDPLKPFVAVGSVSAGKPDPSEQQRAFELRNYTFEALTDDGRRIPISP